MDYTHYQPSEFKVPELPKEAQEKLDVMKEKLDKFSKSLTKDTKDIIGIALLPPTRINPEEKLSHEELEKIKKRINILIVIDVETKKDWSVLRDGVIKKAATARFS